MAGLPNNEREFSGGGLGKYPGKIPENSSIAQLVKDNKLHELSSLYNDLHGLLERPEYKELPSDYKGEIHEDLNKGSIGLITIFAYTLRNKWMKSLGIEDIETAKAEWKENFENREFTTDRHIGLTKIILANQLVAKLEKLIPDKGKKLLMNELEGYLARRAEGTDAVRGVERYLLEKRREEKRREEIADFTKPPLLQK